MVNWGRYGGRFSDGVLIKMSYWLNGGVCGPVMILEPSFAGSVLMECTAMWWWSEYGGWFWGYMVVGIDVCEDNSGE